MAAKALLFDIDGTLWDGHPVYAQALARGSGIRAGEILLRLKQPGANVVRLTDQLGVSRSAFVRECRRNLGLLRLYPCVRLTLEKLQETELAIVTNLPASLVTPMLDDSGLAEFFPIVECAARKPGAAGLIRALAALQRTSTDSSYYIGDSAWDAAAA